MLRPTALLLLALFTPACGASFYARSGDEQLAAGRPLDAVANYHAALEREQLGAAERESVEAKRQAAATAYATAELAAAERLLDEDKRSQAFWRAWRLWGDEAGPLRSASGRRGAERLLTAMVDQRWPEVEARVAEDAWFRAYARARELTAPFADAHPLGQRRAAIRARGHAFYTHLADALSQDAPHAAELHRALAAALAPSPTPGVALAPQAVPWRLIGVEAPADGSCAWLTEALPSGAEPEADGAEVRVTLKACPATETLSVAEQTCDVPDFVVRYETVEEPYVAWESACPEPACVRYDRLGTCVARAAAEACGPPQAVRRTRSRQVARQQPVTRQGACQTFRRHLEAAVTGSGEIAFLDHRQSVPLAVERTVEDQAFWSPGEQQLFTRRDSAGSEGLALARQEVVVEVERRIARALDGLRKAYYRKLAERAVAMTQQGSAVGAEDLLVLAAANLHSLEIPGGPWLAQRFSLTATELLLAVRGEPLLPPLHPPPAPEKLPAPDHGAYELRWQLRPVVNASPRQGTRLLLADAGVDLALTAAQSPLANADFVPGVEAVIRVNPFQLTAGGQSVQVGEQAGGFYLALSYLLDFDLGFASVGLAVAQQTSVAREEYSSFGIPLAIHVPIVEPYLTAELAVELNLLKIKDATDPNPDDPYFLTPIRLGLIGNLGQRFFLRLRASHWPEAPDEEPLHVDGALGVRL